MTPNDATEILARAAADHLFAMLGQMVDDRRRYAVAHGLTVTDSEIAADVRASIERMVGRADR